MKEKEIDWPKIGVFVIVIVIIVSTGLLYARSSEPKPKIGVLNIKGSISGFEYARLAERARDEPSIEAVVLRINSPGGSVTGTFQTETSISKLSREKPVVAALEEFAASGAYVVASAADNIYAYEHTVTAGLGVIAIWVSYENYFEQKGIEYNVWKTGKYKDMFAPWRGPTENENAYINSLVENFEAELYNRIVKNRPEASEQIAAIKDGSTVYGSAALRLNLVDKMGSFNNAVERAAEIAGLEEGEYRKVDLSNHFKEES